MPGKEIKTKLVLEGEREYVNAMKSAADSVKVLDSEQKLAAAQYELTGDAQQYAADKARILKEKIEEQKKAVAAAQEAVKKLKEKGVDPNAKAMQTWKSKLNNAQTALTKLETEMNGSQASAKTLDEELRKAGQGINYQATIQAIDRVTDAIEKTVQAAARMGRAMWDAEMDAGKWADELSTAASAAQMDVETYQSWEYASRFIDTSVDSITKELNRLTKEMGSTSSETAKSFNRLGIVTREADGSVRDATAVFWDAIDALHRIEDPTERAIHAERLFGSSWTDLQPLIEAGSKAYKDLAEEGRQVATVSEENVTKLARLDDAHEKMNAVLEKTKNDALAGLAPAFTEINEALTLAAGALDEFLNSEEGKEAIGELNEAIKGLLAAFLGEDNGKGTFKAIVDGAKEAVRRFTAALTWIKSNGNIVKDVLIGIAAAWAGLKVTVGVLTLLQLVRSAKGVNWSGMGKALGDALGGGTAAGGAGQAAGGSAAAGAGKAAATVGMSAAGDALLYGALPVAGVLAAGLTPAYLADQADRQRELQRLEEEQKTAHEAAEKNGMQDSAALQIVDTVVKAFGESDRKNILGQAILGDMGNIAAASRQVTSLDENSGENVLSTRTRALLKYGGLSAMQEYEAMDTAMSEALARLRQGGGAQAAADTVDTLSDALDEITEMRDRLRESGYGYDKAGNDVGEGLVQLVDKLIDDPAVYGELREATQKRIAEYLNEESGFGVGSNTRVTDAEEMMNLLFEDMDAAYYRAVEAGKGVSDGMAAGIGENAKGASDAAAQLAEGTAAAAMQALGEHSPSIVFQGIGEMAVIGLANGIYDRGGEAIRASEWLAAQVEQTLRSRLDIHSPSRVAQALGGFFVTGFAEGIERSLSEIDRATAHMASAAVRPAARGGGGSGSSAGPAPGTVHVTLVVDKQAVGEIVAPVVDGWIGAQVEAMR